MRKGIILRSLVCLLVLISFTIPTLAANKVTIKNTFWGDPLMAKLFDQLKAKFEAKYKNIQIENISYPQGEYATKIQTMIAGGISPDIMMGVHGGNTLMMDRGVFLELDRFLKGVNMSRYFPASVQACKYKGKTYAMPVDFSPLVMFYNASMLERAGLKPPKPDWTWNDYLEYGRKLTSDTNNDGKADQYGAVLSVNPYDYIVWIWNNGGDIIDEKNNRAVIDQPAAYEALQYLVDLRDKHKVAAPSSVVATAGDFQMFMSGQLAFYQGGPWLLKAFRGIKDFKWDVVPIPGNKAHYTNLIQGLSYIYAKTRYPKESWEWVKFISGPDGQRIRTEMGQGVPSIKALANSSLFLDRTQPPKGIKTIIDVMKNAKLMFNQPRSGEIFVALAQNLDSMWVGNESAKEATARTAQALNKILQEK